MDAIADFSWAYAWYLLIPVVFIALVVWIYRPGAKGRYTADGKIPFDEDSAKRQAKTPH